MRFVNWKDDDPEPSLVKVIKEYDSGIPVILPTDTIYGISAPVDRPDAISKIFEIKGRPKDLTLPLAVGNWEQLERFSTPDQKMMSILRENLPGPCTFILPSSEGLPPDVIRNGTVAIRIPDHPIFPLLCGRVGPVALTSANKHGEPPFSGPISAERSFSDLDLLMVIDDGTLTGGPSSIIDITKEVPMLLRNGNVFIEKDMRGQDG